VAESNQRDNLFTLRQLRLFNIKVPLLNQIVPILLLISESFQFCGLHSVGVCPKLERCIQEWDMRVLDKLYLLKNSQAVKKWCGLKSLGEKS